MRTERLFVAGVGVYLPKPTSTREAVRLGHYDQADHEAGGWTGAATADDVAAPDMAVLAGRQALARSGHPAADIDLLVHASTYHQGPDGWSAAHYVQRHTIGGHAPALELRGPCTGVLSAIELAHCYLQTAGGTAALITGADNFGGPLVDRWRYASGAGNNRPSILGDAGTAAVLSRRTGFAEVLAVGSASVPELEELNRPRRPLFPPDCTMGQGLDLGARAAWFAEQNPGAFSQAKAALAKTRTELAERTLAQAGISATEVTRATHVFTGGEPYLNSVFGPLGIKPSQCALEFGRSVGHLGTGDHLAALDHLSRTGQLEPNDHILMLGNGIGAAVACVVLRITAGYPEVAHTQEAGMVGPMATVR